MPIGGKFPHLLWYQYVPLIGYYLINVKTRGAGGGGGAGNQKRMVGGNQNLSWGGRTFYPTSCGRVLPHLTLPPPHKTTLKKTVKL